MISSPCRNCCKRQLPKDTCMNGCEKIAAIQQLEHVMSAPPYACEDGSDAFFCRSELPLVQVPSVFSYSEER
jgi:hypothetical protein